MGLISYGNSLLAHPESTGVLAAANDCETCCPEVPPDWPDITPDGNPPTPYDPAECLGGLGFIDVCIRGASYAGCVGHARSIRSGNVNRHYTRVPNTGGVFWGRSYASSNIQVDVWDGGDCDLGANVNTLTDVGISVILDCNAAGGTATFVSVLVSGVAGTFWYGEILIPGDPCIGPWLVPNDFTDVGDGGHDFFQGGEALVKLCVDSMTPGCP